MNQEQSFKLSASRREITGKKVKSLRSKGIVPAVIYGHGGKPQPISIGEKEFEKIYREAGTSSLVDLAIADEKPVKVLTHEPQNNPVTDKPIHVDFYRVRMDKKIKTEIPLEFIGESEAVEQNDGSLVTNRDSVEVECLPADLINHITVDIAVLKTFEDTITVANLSVPQEIEVLTDKEEVIALVEPPRSEEELAELETPTATEEEKEAIEKMGAEAETKGIEGEEGEEGETGDQIKAQPGENKEATEEKK